MTVVARNAFHLGLRQALTTGLAVVLAAVLGRMLGPADFGLLYLVTSMSTLALVIADAGQTQLVIREVARHPEDAGDLLGAALALRVAGAVLLAVLTWLAALVLGYDARTAGLAGLLVLTMTPFFLAQACGFVFRGHDRMDLDALLMVVNKALAFPATLLLLWLGAGVIGAVAAQAIAGAGALVMAFVLLRRARVPRLRVSWPRARALLVSGLPILLVSLAVAAQTYLDAVVLSKLAPASSVGWFAAARNVFGTLIAPATILATATFPALARAAHDPARLRAEIESTLRPLVGLAALGAAGTYLFADPAIALIYGSGTFFPAAAILRVFAPGFFLLFMDVLLCVAVYAVARPRPLALAKWLNVACTTGLAFVLVPYFERTQGNGGMGIAVAFVTSEVIMFVSALRLLPRGTLQRSSLLDVARALAASLGTVAIVRLLPALPFYAALPLSVVVFVALAAALGLVRREEVARVRALLTRTVAATGAGAAR
jgi:O-antigen/teichoic acid export membrane protein